MIIDSPRIVTMVMATEYLSMFSLAPRRCGNQANQCHSPLLPSQALVGQDENQFPNIIGATLNVQTSAKKGEITGVTVHMHAELLVSTIVKHASQYINE